MRCRTPSPTATTPTRGPDRDPAQAGPHALTDAVIAEIQRENTSFVSGAQWQGRRIMRVSVIARHTGSDDMTKLGDSIIRAWQHVLRRGVARSGEPAVTE